MSTEAHPASHLAPQSASHLASQSTSHLAPHSPSHPAPCPLPRDASLDEIRTAFALDRFAVGLCGARIDEAAYGHAVCSLRIEDHHLNLMGAVMGGAIFTLADFCLAVISNVGEPPSASVSATIEYLSTAKGDTLIAVASADRQGRRLGFYTIDVSDNVGTPVARMVATVLRNP